MWNWTFEASVKGRVSLSELWKVWTDVSGWPSWDDELEWSRIEGPFAAGTSGHLKPKGWSPLKFTITKVIEHKEFRDKTAMPLGTSLEFRHTVDSVGSEEYLVKHRVHAKGLLAPILRFTLRRKLKAKMPRALRALIAKAGESNE